MGDVSYQRLLLLGSFGFGKLINPSRNHPQKGLHDLQGRFRGHEVYLRITSLIHERSLIINLFILGGNSRTLSTRWWTWRSLIPRILPIWACWKDPNWESRLPSSIVGIWFSMRNACSSMPTLWWFEIAMSFLIVKSFQLPRMPVGPIVSTLACSSSNLPTKHIK